jgi:hypothetical protein
MMKDDFVQPMSSDYFDRRDIEIAPGEVVVVSCMRDECERLPFFLEYYRNLGVTRFLMVDNDSKDDTRDFLSAQPDVEYFWTDSSYRGSSAGRLWMQELADTYAQDRWVVTVDVDELLVFPGAERLTLPELCNYMDDNSQDGLFTVMLDMYSDRPLSQTRYERGGDFFDTCPYFETDSYRIAPGSNPPFLSIIGGPRDRLFAKDGRRRPMMKKIPLVRWREGFSYIYSTHSHRHIQLSDITGVLTHFKFFSTFRDVATVEAERGDRRQPEHYRAYSESAYDDVCFYSTNSFRYSGPADFVRLGVMRSSERYQAFVATQSRLRDAASDGREFLPEPIAPEGGLTIRSMAAVWPLVSNAAIPAYFGVIAAPPADHRRAFVREMSRHVRVVDVKPDHLLVRLDEPVLHRWQRSNLAMAVYVGSRLVRRVLVDGSDDAFSVDVRSLEPNICKLDADIAGAATFEGDGRPWVGVTTYLFDADDDRMPAATESVGTMRSEDTLIYSQPWFIEGGNVAFVPEFRGGIDRLTGGRLRGWAYDVNRDTFDVAVCVFINGRLTNYLWPTERRHALDEMVGSGRARGRGFVVELPFGYFDGVGDEELTVDVKVAGRNLFLRRSPLTLTRGVRDARWDDHARQWMLDGTDRAVPEPIAMNRADSLQRVNAASYPESAQETSKSPWWKNWA